MQNKTAIIIPAYNEGKVLGQTLSDVKLVLKNSHFQFDLIVVDDGSHDNTRAVAQKFADTTIRHRHNCGLGAALATGIEYAKRNHYKQLVTFDADGQHYAKDILRAVETLNSGADVVIGSRFLGRETHIPLVRRLILRLSNIVTYFFFGVWTTDSQSGFRGLSLRAISQVSIKSNRMEVSSEFFGEVRRLNLKLIEFPIRVKYTQYSLSKGQSNTASWGVLLKLLYLIGR